MPKINHTPNRASASPHASATCSRWLTTFITAAALWLAAAAFAHEVIVTPSASGRYHVNVGGAAHLQADQVDFGEDLVGTSTTRTVTVTNVNRRAVQVVPSPPANMTVSPAVLDLEPAGEAGDAGLFTLVYTRTAEGTFTEELDLAVSHEGVARAKQEAIDYSVVAVTPPRLELSVPELGLTDISSVDLGYLSNRHYDPYEHPSFELVVTNTGGSTAQQLALNFQELLFTYPSPWGYGDCSSNELMNLCVIGEDDLDVHHLGDLAPGESVSTTWTMIPYDSGAYHPTLKFLTADPEVYAYIEVVVENIPFTLPEKRLYQDLSTAVNHMGTVESPFGDDPLAQLRPKGFDSRTIFSLGDFDSVDLRGGNLTFIVPIGEAIKARGPLSYSLKAVYNSDLWYRQTLDEIEMDDPNLPGRVQPVSGEWPDPIYNLVGGWSFHLGRLVPPNNFDGVDVEHLCSTQPPAGTLDHEYRVHTGKHFVYIDSFGTSREFWAKPHGDEPYYSGDPDWDDLETRQYTYTRDGSHLRMWKENQNTRWVEETGGLRRRFQNLGRSHTDTLNDEWLLTRIQDHHGNYVDINYGESTWTLTDSASWRQVKVYFQDWTGRRISPSNQGLEQPLIVDKVELPGFDGGAVREYDFQYTFKTIHRPARSNFHHLEGRTDCLDYRVTLPLISRINVPDGTHWAFDYEHRALAVSSNDDDSRMVEATLPTKGVVHYAYADRVFDTGNNCTSFGNDNRGHGGVERRWVTEGGATLENTRYLREIRRTDDIPFDYCEIEQAPSNRARPWSQQRVAVWKDLGEPPESGSFGSTYAPPKSTLKLHHFNIWPYSDRCNSNFPDHCSLQGGRWVLDSGRSHIERNLMIDLSQASGDLNRSTETFECSTRPSGVGWNNLSGENPSSPNPSAGDTIQDALTGCTKVEETWARYEVSLAGNCTQASSPNCLRDSRLLKEKTVFREKPNGDEHHRLLVNSDYDGLGHYRRQTVSTSSASTWANDGLSKPLARTTFRDYNPGVGTLKLDANHRVTQDLNHLPSPWLLETYERFWTKEGSTYRGGDACFDSTTGALEGTRSWRCTSGDNYNCSGAEGALSGVRTWQDVVTVRTVDSTGELDRERFYGGDGGTGVAPTADLCTVDPADGNADYIVDYTYDFGYLKTKKIDGASTFEIRRTIDQSTGWPLTETLDSGEVLTFDYDGVGRRTEMVSDRAASFDFYYFTDAGTDRRRLQARTFGLNGLSAPLLRTYVAEYDGLGRLKKEFLPKAGGGTVDRSYAYDRGGRVKSVQSLEGGNTAFSYDYRGRPLVVRFPDDTRKEYLHYGERWSREFNCVGTAGGTSSSGVCRNSVGEGVETSTFKDFFGRTRRLEIQGTGGTRTDFVYDPADKMRSATRSSNGGGTSQTRSWLYDGLGFLLQESIPEQNTTTYSGHDTRGNPGLEHIGGRYLGYSYDELGRPTSITSDEEILKSFFYHDTGGGNGQLEKGTRRVHHDGLYTAGGPGFIETVSTFGYDSSGRRSSRTTHVDFIPDSGNTQRLGQFTQTWQFDPVGNVDTLGYPTCITGNYCTDDVLSVDYGYSQGFYLTDIDVGGSSTLGADLVYHPSGLVNQVIHQGGGTDVYGIAGGRLRIASMDLASGTASALDLGAVTYDASGNIRTIGGESFDYDRLGRLTAATVRAPGGTTASYNYSYDVFDNRTTPFPSDLSTNRPLLPDAQWDAFGNMIAAGSTTAIYDPFDKLTAINVPAADPEDPINRQISVYDHDDLRVLRWNKLEFVPPGTVPEEPVWTLRDGLRVIREVTGTGPEAKTSADFIYAGQRLISSRRYTGTAYGSGDERHYHADQVGNSRLITGHDGKEVYFQPFGGPVDPSITSGERTVGFQGHETDGAVTYMRGRHYYPGIGRFIQVDPGRDASAWSLYSFGANNPINMVDATGHETSTATENWVASTLTVIGLAATKHPFVAIPAGITALALGVNSQIRSDLAYDTQLAIDGAPNEAIATIDEAIVESELQIIAAQRELRFLQLEAGVDENGQPDGRSETQRTAMLASAEMGAGFERSVTRGQNSFRQAAATASQTEANHRLLRLRELKKELVRASNESRAIASE